ncbi:MAG: hypothetical protein AAGE52_23625, partial [Myxococcota bacterium]
MTDARPARPKLPEIDVREHGAKRGDVEQAIDRRLFMQLLVFNTPVGQDPQKYEKAFAAAFEEKLGINALVYADANDPRGLGLLSWSEDPEYFVEVVRPLFRREHLRDLILRPEMTMLGRTYSVGHEQNVAHWILERPIENVSQEGWEWAVWYPLRRSGEFESLSREEQR